MSDIRSSICRLGGTLVVAAALLAITGACSPRVNNHGNVPDKDKVAQIKAGQSTQQQVARLLGSPSTIAAFDNRTWYYISKREENLAFFKPTVKDQQVLVIRFDQAGVVRNVKKYGLKDANDVKLVARQTPTRSREPGLLRALYGTLLRGPLRTLGGSTTNEGFER
ncbi:MAG: outer membrane protein assembly factor BamE [Pseudomonadota bacterium]